MTPSKETEKETKTLLLDLADAGAPRPGTPEFDEWLESAEGQPFAERVQEIEGKLDLPD